VSRVLYLSWGERPLRNAPTAGLVDDVAQRCLSLGLLTVIALALGAWLSQCLAERSRFSGTLGHL